MRDDWMGGLAGDVADAVEFAREIATEWEQRVVCRLDGGRTNDGTLLLWTIYEASA